MKPALKHLIGPLCATMALFALIAGYWYREDQETAVKRDEALDRSASIAQSLIAQRLERFESILRGVKGHYENSESVTPEEFKHYVGALHLDPVQVALMGIAIALRIDHVDKDRHTAAMRSTISDVYRIQPEGMRPQYTPIVLIEPLDATNEKALGFDISTNPTVLEALQRSLPTGEAVLTGSTVLTQDAGKNLPAVVMYLPLVAKDGKHVLGWVSGPFRIEDLVAAVASGMDPDVNLVIHDGIAPSPANRMYGVAPADPAVPTVRLLEVGGRTWSLLLYTTTKFESRYANASHWFIAFIGGIASILFGFAYWQMETGRARAKTKALAMTRELRELEVVRQATLDAIPDLLFEADVNGVILAYHAHRGDLLAAPPEVFMGKNFAEVLPAEATEVCMAAIRRAAVEGYATGAVYVLPLEQGDTWFEMSVSTLPETEGREKHFVLLTRDITERKVAELALKATNGQLQLLETCVARLNDIVLITEAEPFGNPGPRIVFVNDAFERRTGFSREEVIGKTPRILQGPKTDRKELDRIRAALERWEPVRAELLNYTKTGQEFWIELDIVPVADATGWFTHWVAIERDISERRQFELARQESEMRLRLVIRGGDIGFWDWDLRGSGLIVNERWCEMLGLNPKALALDIDVWNSLVHPDDAPTLVRLFEQVIQNPNGQGGEVEVRARHQAGHYVWILDRFSIVSRAADGTPLRAVGTHLDITERKVAELALQATLQEKTALLLEVHHRVKNNLQVITSLLRLESFRSTDAPTKSVLQDMQGRVRSMALLHETIYRKGTFAAIDLGSYAGQIAGESMKSMQVNPGAVRLQLDMEKLQVGLDQATPAGMLVSELISNSLKHAFPEGRTGEICISLHPLDTSDEWRLRVSDSGIGLPSDFEERCKTSLGLQLAFDMAKQMGGTLHIGAGPQAVFTVDFKAEVPAPLKINLDGVKP